MKKTNLRIRNQFIFEDKNDYYLSSVIEHEEWKHLEENNYNDFKEKKVTERLNDLMEEYDIYTCVNFYDVDDEDDDDTKKIEIKQSGGK